MIKTSEKTHLIQLKLKAIPSSWKAAAGLASKKSKALSAHTQKVRSEWSKQ